jgi:hypothetical protein
MLILVDDPNNPHQGFLPCSPCNFGPRQRMSQDILLWTHGDQCRVMTRGGTSVTTGQIRTDSRESFLLESTILGWRRRWSVGVLIPRYCLIFVCFVCFVRIIDAYPDRLVKREIISAQRAHLLFLLSMSKRASRWENNITKQSSWTTLYLVWLMAWLVIVFYYLGTSKRPWW